jgi:hypothetical protein
MSTLRYTLFIIGAGLFIWLTVSAFVDGAPPFGTRFSAPSQIEAAG